MAALTFRSVTFVIAVLDHLSFGMQHSLLQLSQRYNQYCTL
jgi:hypothetical protein